MARRTAWQSGLEQPRHIRLQTPSRLKLDSVLRGERDAAPRLPVLEGLPGQAQRTGSGASRAKVTANLSECHNNS